MRTTYFVPPGSDSFRHFRSGEVDGAHGVHVNGLKAAKHVQDRRAFSANPGVDIVNIEFFDGKANLRGLPFDPPARTGLFITASLASDPEEVVKACAQAGFAFDAAKNKVVTTEDYLYWFVRAGDVKNEGAVRVTLVEDMEMREEWHGSELRSEFVPLDAGELGVFTIENTKPGVLVLSGRVRNGKSEAETLEEADVSDETYAEKFGSPMILRWYPKHVEMTRAEMLVRLAEPYGLHPKLMLDLKGIGKPRHLQSCKLYAQLDLSTDLFIDQYEISDYDRAPELIAMFGDNDLEKPTWQAHEAVSGLFALHGAVNGGAKYEVPLHFRYAVPNDDKYVDGEIMSPYVFWACRNDDIPEREEQFINPREFLGIESVFPIDSTQFYTVPAQSVQYRVPTIPHSSRASIERLTVLVIVVGALCVLVSIIVKLFRKDPLKKMKVE